MMKTYFDSQKEKGENVRKNRRSREGSAVNVPSGPIFTWLCLNMSMTIVTDEVIIGHFYSLFSSLYFLKT